MSVIIRLQNLPWSANALDIRNYFRGLSIPEGGVHIVGGELGDAFIAFSTDEDARQAMMLDCGKIKEIQVKLHLSSRSEMHKVIEAARQTVPLMLAPTPPVVSTPPVVIPPPTLSAPKPAPMISPFHTSLGNNLLSNFGIPGLGNPTEIPQPAVIPPPAPLISPGEITRDDEKEEELDKRRKDRRRSRSRTRSRDRERKDRKRDRRDRSRSKERRRRDRSRSRERRGKRERNNRSRSRDRSPSLRSRGNRRGRSPLNSANNSQEKDIEPAKPFMNPFANPANLNVPLSQMLAANVNVMQNGPVIPPNQPMNRFNNERDPAMFETLNKMQELAKKRNPNAFQRPDNRMENERDNQNGGKGPGRGGNLRGREGRISRFDDQLQECCVAIRHAPNHTTYGDVRKFFPFVIDKHGIKMINDNMGRRTGNIFVRFCEVRSKQLALQRKNNELKGAQVLVEDLDDELYDMAVDSFLPVREDNDDDDRNMVVNIPEVELPQPNFTVLKITDLPNYVKEHDIIKTFGDFSLLEITLNDDRMTRSKIAFVEFAKPEDARKAFAEHKGRIAFGRRHATVTKVSDEEYHSLVKNSPFENLERDQREIREEREEAREPPMRQVENTGPRDPRQRRPFDGPAPNASANIQGPNQGGPMLPFPQFPQQGAFPTTFGAMPSGFPGTGGVDPRTAATNWANRHNFPNQMENNRQPDKKNIEDELLDCVLMKGLPRDATDRTIVNFLSDTGAVPARIHLMLDQVGQPSGDCFCEFRTSQEARMAIAKHGKNLDGFRITVDLVPRAVVEEALDGPTQIEPNGPMPTSGPGPMPSSGPAPMQGSGPGPMQGSGPGPMQGSGPGPMQGPGPQGNQPQFFEMRGGGFSGRGGFRGRGGFGDRGGFSDRGGFNDRGGFGVRGGYRGRGGFDRGGPPRGGFDGRGRGRGRGGRFENGGGREESNDPALEDFGAPGCVVSVENVPFRATIDEILQFFSDFELTQDDIIRRYNEFGQPTGDARISFRTPFDAQRAVKTRHMDTIHQRRINLTIL